MFYEVKLFAYCNKTEIESQVILGMVKMAVPGIFWMETP